MARQILNEATRRMNDDTRFQRVRDLEHYCRCYVNAYVQQLQGGRTMRLSVEKARIWQRILDAMFGVLVQEGVVEKIEGDEE
jgi:hypothetical protein